MTGILTSILAVFTAVGEWISTAVDNLVPMFYGTEGLTFLGVLAVAGLAFSVVFLIIGLCFCLGPRVSDDTLKTSLTAGTSH